jgi:hypothetical protein
MRSAFRRCPRGNLVEWALRKPLHDHSGYTLASVFLPGPDMRSVYEHSSVNAELLAVCALMGSVSFNFDSRRAASFIITRVQF